MQNFKKFQLDGFWLVAIAAVLWGTIGVATQGIYEVDNTSSLFINMGRMLIATPVLLLMSWRLLGAKLFQVQKRDLAIMILTGILLAISHGAYFAAIRYTGVTIATLITICIAPIVVSSVSVLLKLEKLSQRVLIALVMALVGIVLLVGLSSPADADYDLFLGTIFSLVAAITYAAVIICGRLLASDYHPLQVTTISFSAATLVLVLINLGYGIVPIQSSQGWLLIIYLGLVPSAFAYWIFQMGLRSVSATTASILSMLDPLVAALLAWGLFGETLAVTGITGAGLLLLSIFLLSLDNKSEKTPLPQTEI